MATTNAMSNYLENKILVDNLSGTCYIGLFTTNPNETNLGTEVTGGNYARQSITFTITNNQALNNKLITFPTATGGWGEVSHFGIYDSVVGNLLFYGALENASNVNTVFTILATDIFKFPINSLSIVVD